MHISAYIQVWNTANSSVCIALSEAGREHFHKSWLVSGSKARIHACNVGRGESVAVFVWLAKTVSRTTERWIQRAVGWCALAQLSTFWVIQQRLPLPTPPPLPPSSDCRINIRRLNSCLVADVSCCYTSLSLAPGGERSKQGYREVKAEILLKMLHVDSLREANKWASACPSCVGHHLRTEIRISIIDYNIQSGVIPPRCFESSWTNKI